jgi:hypothetical protein
MANEIVDAIREQILEIIEDAKDAMQPAAGAWDKVTTAIGLIRPTIERIVKIVETLDIAGVDKRTAALACVDSFYDTVIAPIDLPGIPNFLEGAVDSAGGVILHSVAGYLIDAAVEYLNMTGVFSHGTS